MFESEEKSPHKLPLPVPKKNDGSSSQAIDEDIDREGGEKEQGRRI